MRCIPLMYNTGSPRWKTYDSNFAGGDYSIYKKSTSSSSTPTVSSVTVSPATLSLDVYNNKTGNLTATVIGTNSPAQTVNWSTSASSVATVSNGVVTAKGKGTATITATSTVDLTKSGSCTVTVTDSTPKTLSSISISGQKTAFTIGDTFSFGGTVTAHFSDSTTSNVTSSASFSGYDMNTAGNQTVTVSYTYSGTTKTATYSITVSSSGGSSSGDSFTITFKTGTGDGTSMSTSTTESNYLSAGGDYIKSIATATSCYYAGSSGLKLGVSGGGGTLTLNLEDAYQGEVESIVVNAKLYNSSKSATLNVNSAGAKSVTSSFTDISFDINSSITSISLNSSKYIWVSGVTVNMANTEDKIVDSLSATYTGGDVYVGGTLDTSTVSVTATYTDSSKYPAATLSSSDYSLSEFSSTTAGTKTITVTYIGSLSTSHSPMTTTFNVTVINDSVQSISVSSNKTTAHPGETISKSNVTLTVTWASGKQTNPTDFEFATYQFTYEDAPSGGTTKNKAFTVNYAGKSASFNVSVSRTAYNAPTSSALQLTGTQVKSAGVTGTTASAIADYDSLSVNGVTCSAHNVYVYTSSNVNYISFGTGIGDIYNTAPVSKPIISLSITRRSTNSTRTDDKLYVSVTGDEADWVLVANADFVNNDYRYFKVAYETTSSNYSNFSSINIGLAGTDNPTNVSNYIMFEDTNNQCETKFNAAIGKLNTMSSSDKTTFMTSNDYVIATARNRLENWARHFGKTISLSNDTIVVSSNSLVSNPIITSNTDSIAVIVILAVASLTVIGGYFFLRKKKEI